MANEPTIAEMNSVIAVFDGGEWKKDDYGEYGFFFPHRRPTAKEALKYHTSWSWLMPVGKKIYDLLVDMSKKRRPHTACHGDLLELDITCHIREYNINKAHEAVYQFCKWLNQQKQTNDTER